MATFTLSHQTKYKAFDIFSFSYFSYGFLKGQLSFWCLSFQKMSQKGQNNMFHLIRFWGHLAPRTVSLDTYRYTATEASEKHAYLTPFHIYLSLTLPSADY